MTGCDKLFLCSLPDWKDMDREPRQASHIVKIAKDAGISQVIGSTSMGVFTLDEAKAENIAPDSFMTRHLINKKSVELAIQNGGFQHWTILRPSFFMANFLEPKVARYPEPKQKGTWTTAMLPNTKLALIDHVDIAAVAAAAYQVAATFHGRVLGLASEMLTVQQTLDLLGEATSRTFQAVFLTDEEIAENSRHSNVFTNSQVSMRYMSNFINMDNIASIIRPTTFKEFLNRERKLAELTYSR